MINTSNIKYCDGISQAWLFKRLLDIDEELRGQSVKIKSIFKEEKTPSMVVYFSNATQDYAFKDFSSGHGGNAITLYALMYNVSLATAEFECYKLYVEEKPLTDYLLPKDKVINNQFLVTDYEVRDWKAHDLYFWNKFNININILNTYNVKPICKYTIKVVKGNVENIYTFNKEHTYGYFTTNNILYKIYNPYDKPKFVLIKDHIQGYDQFTYNTNTVGILSSLKDIMAFKSLKFNFDCVAPDSESTLLNESFILDLLTTYKNVFVMLDNDAVGKKYSAIYQEKYHIHPIYFNVEKDIANCIEVHGAYNTKLFLLSHFKRWRH